VPGTVTTCTTPVRVSTRWRDVAHHKNRWRPRAPPHGAPRPRPRALHGDDDQFIVREQNAIPKRDGMMTGRRSQDGLGYALRIRASVSCAAGEEWTRAVSHRADPPVSATGIFERGAGARSSARGGRRGRATAGMVRESSSCERDHRRPPGLRPRRKRRGPFAGRRRAALEAHFRRLRGAERALARARR
jgi:hypothetical protein